MISINLKEAKNYNVIAKIINSEMKYNGIKKSEIISETGLSKTTVYNILRVNNKGTDYHLKSLLKILDFLNMTIYIGKNEENNKVLSLF